MGKIWNRFNYRRTWVVLEGPSVTPMGNPSYHRGEMVYHKYTGQGKDQIENFLYEHPFIKITSEYDE